MATWKELRALQAAQQAAEAQRETEARRGQREAQTWQQVLGTVDQLIGLAPQAIGAYETGEAQKVLAGERPLEREKPKDVLEGIAQFISSPFEGGVQRRAKAMAGEMAPAELEKIRPTLTQAIGGVPEANKFLVPRDRLTEQEVVQREIKRSPVLSLLPEQQREAIGFGETQRVQAEQAAKAREQEMFDLQKKKIEAQAGVPKAQQVKVGLFVDAALPAVMKTAKEFRDQLNSDQPAVANEAADSIAASADQALAPLVASGDIAFGSPEYEAAKGQVIRKATEAEKKKVPEEKTIQPFLQDQSLIGNLIRLTDLRKKSNWSPSQERIIQQVALEGINLFGFETIPQSLQGVIDRIDMTPAQQAYYKEALALRREIMVALNGPGVLSNQDTNELAKAAINPFSTNDEWNATANAMLERVGTLYSNRLDALGGIYSFPQSVIQFGKQIPKSVGEVVAGDVPFGGMIPSEREAIAQRSVEQTIKLPEPIIAALTSLAGQGVEKIGDEAMSAIMELLRGQTAAPAAPAPAPAPAAPTAAAPTAAAPANGSVLVEITDRLGVTQQRSVPQGRLQKLIEMVKIAGGSYRIIEGK